MLQKNIIIHIKNDLEDMMHVQLIQKSAAMIMCPCVDGISHNEAEEIKKNGR